jgi:hypothetical protein
MCLSDPGLGEGTVVEDVGLLAHVIFESTEATLPVSELEYVNVDDSGNREVESGTGGRSRRVPPLFGAPRGRPFTPSSRVVCPSRPWLGLGTVESLKDTFTVSYESGLKTQTDEEIRPVSSDGPGPPASVRGQHNP